MKLGFHYHVPFHCNSEGSVTVPGYLGRFLDSLSTQVEELVCFMHSATSDELRYSDYPLQAPNLRWIDIGPHKSIPKRMLSAQRSIRLVRNERNNLDAILIRGPSPLLPAVANALNDLPIALLLVGDYLAGIDDLPQPRWRKEAIRFWSYWNFRGQMSIARQALTFVNSRKLYEQYQSLVPSLIETRTTTLSKADFYERNDTCQSYPIHLLYTGRMDRAKGLFEIVEAVHILLKQGNHVILDLVGWPAKGDTIVEELLQDAKTRGIDNYVVYHGFKPVGPELFAYYKAADIYLIASQASEGFPRTIWEAMAHGLPIVTTRVGSIPHFLAHGESVWLLNDKTGSAIAAGIREIIQHPDIRTKLIQQAYQIARENTLEVRTRELITALASYMSGKTLEA